MMPRNVTADPATSTKPPILSYEPRPRRRSVRQRVAARWRWFCKARTRDGTPMPVVASAGLAGVLLALSLFALQSGLRWLAVLLAFPLAVGASFVGLILVALTWMTIGHSGRFRCWSDEREIARLRRRCRAWGDPLREPPSRKTKWSRYVTPTRRFPRSRQSML
jgi:hypothetical protein